MGGGPFREVLLSMSLWLQVRCQERLSSKKHQHIRILRVLVCQRRSVVEPSYIVWPYYGSLTTPWQNCHGKSPKLFLVRPEQQLMAQQLPNPVRKHPVLAGHQNQFHLQGHHDGVEFVLACKGHVGIAALEHHLVQMPNFFL